MPPFDIGALRACHADVLDQLSASESLKRFSTRGSRWKNRLSHSQNILSLYSPLTPWEDEAALRQKRKVSIKFSNRNVKSLKSNTKDKKKNKKELRKQAGLSAKSTDSNKKEYANDFQYHSDVGEYMRDYRKSKNMVAMKQEDFSYLGIYGLEDIEKAYESLGIPKLEKRKRSFASSKKTTFPPVKEVPVICQGSPEPIDFDSESNSEQPTKDREHEGALNQTAKEKVDDFNHLASSGNVNTLPKVGIYALQSTSGLDQTPQGSNVFPTSKEDFPQIKKNTNSIASKRQSRYFSLAKKQLPIRALHLQENVLSRLDEISLPDVHLAQDRDMLNIGTKQNSIGLPEIAQNCSEFETEFLESSSCCISPMADVQKVFFSKTQDDARELAEGPNRSCQSSALSSTAEFSLESSCSNYSICAKTTKERLSTHVKHLHPFSRNGKRIQNVRKKTEGSFDAAYAHNLRDSPKQLVSSQIYRNLSYKPSMRKFIEELYLPEKEKSLLESNDTCVVAGKQLQKTNPSSIPPLLQFPPKYGQVATRLRKKSKSILQIDTTKTLKKGCEPSEKKNVDKSVRHVVALEKQRMTKPAKLALVMKCNTLIKPNVSVRGVAL